MAGQNIPGIYNYCDRWCERCPFTSRCAVFQDETGGQRDKDVTRNEAFWKRLSENVAKAQSLFEDIAAKQGIDLQTLVNDHENDEKLEAALTLKVDEHPVARLTREYEEMTNEWLKTQPGMLEKLEKLKDELTLGVESHEQAKVQAHTIKDSLAVIKWYSGFIHTKFKRALRGKLEVERIDATDPAFRRDYNGAAKITLIAIEKSIQAWVEIFNILPEQEDVFLKILAMLDKSKRMTLDEFPDAMSFVRPGFDEASRANVL